MKLRRCSLRKMMNDGLVDEQIKLEVLNKLKEWLSNSNVNNWPNGDLKECEEQLLNQLN